MVPKFSHSLDHVLIRHGLIHAWGWVIAPDIIPDRAELQALDDVGNALDVLECRLWQERPDLARYFPGVPHARHAGFMVFGAVPGPGRTSQGQLAFFKRDQIVFCIPISFHSDRRPKDLLWLRSLKRKWGQLSAEWQRGGWQGVVRKVRATRNRMLCESDIETCVTAINARVVHVDFSWIVDHDMGGGANLYRDGQMHSLVARDSTPILLGFNVATLRYFVALPTIIGQPRWQLDGLVDIERLLEAFPPVALIYNCAVSFPEPLRILDHMLQAKRRHGARFTVLVHDYFIVCPSHTLLDSNRTFCAVPNRTVCNKCLTRHTDGFVSIARNRDISQWRLAWKDALSLAYEVRFFSEASRRLVRKAYPDVETNIWRVVPHMLHTPVERPRLQRGECLHLGFVGNIAYHKGAEWVSALAHVRAETSADVRLSVVGSLEGLHPLGVTVTGPYETAKLPFVLESLGINVVFFSSICPETFSYVAHELVEMNVPTACFSLGAPGDLIGAYPRGCVISHTLPREVLEQLIQFWNRVYPMPGEEA